MAGKAENISPMWAKFKQDLSLEEPVPFNNATYLGCTQKDSPVCQKTVQDKKELFDRLLKVDHKLEQQPSQAEPKAKAKAKAKSKAAAKPKPKAKAKKPSNNSESSLRPRDNLQLTATSSTSQAEPSKQRVKAYHYDMSGHAERCVAKYEELAGVKAEDLKQVATPCIDDHIIPPEDFEAKGELSHVAARIVLTVLFLARTGRPDLLWTVNTLARETTRWNVACDKRLNRLIGYIHHTKHHVHHCFVGDAPHECWLAVFSDASFAGDLRDSKSTSGCYLCLVGPRTFVPITWFAKKQGAVSHSSTEAEIISLDACLRMEGIPCLAFWSQVVQVFPGPKSPKLTLKVKAGTLLLGTILRMLIVLDLMCPLCITGQSSLSLRTMMPLSRCA